MNEKSWQTPDGTAHEWCTVLVFIGSRSLGQFLFDPGAHPELRYRRSGVSFYCPWCGEIWARLVLVDSDKKQMPLDALSVACERHVDSYCIPGSLLAWELEHLLPLLPPEAVRREFTLHFNQAMKEEG